MGSVTSMISSNKNTEQIETALAKAKQIVNSNPAVVFGKTDCGYCKRVKQLLSQLNATYKVIDLDEESDGDEIQMALVDWTGQNTVPNVFIGGKHIGGCDSVMEKHNEGKLVLLLIEAEAGAGVGVGAGAISVLKSSLIPTFRRAQA